MNYLFFFWPLVGWISVFIPYYIKGHYIVESGWGWADVSVCILATLFLAPIMGPMAIIIILADYNNKKERNDSHAR